MTHCSFKHMGIPVAIAAMLFINSSIAAQAKGPLLVHPDNPRYFMVKDDPEKKVVYLTGSHIWCNFQDYIVSDNPDYNIGYNTIFETLQKYGHNFTRGWHWEDAEYSPLPFERTGPDKANDGKPKFDLAQYNQSYYDRLRKRISQAGKHGIYISVMLFEGWSIENKGGGRTPNPWPNHPFNKNNNINNINGDSNGDGQGPEIHTLKVNPKITALQESYAKHTIDQLGDLDNIIWEISNESHRNSINWQYHMTNMIHDYEKTKPKQHLVWMNFYDNSMSNDCLFNSPADIISPHKYPNFRNPPPSKGDKVILLDTDHLWGVGGNADWVWKSFTRGYQPIFMDPLHNKPSHCILLWSCWTKGIVCDYQTLARCRV